MKKHIGQFKLSLTIILMIFSPIGFAVDDSALVKRQISELIHHKITEQKTAVGVSVAIIENDQIEFLNYGLVEKQNNKPTSVDSLLEIGSISKTFTSLALASMVTEGKVKLTDPVQKYLPDSVKMPKRNGKEITLGSLANHSSGLPRLPNNMPFTDPSDPYADYTVTMMYQFLNDYELTRDVAESIEYSNLAVGLLGHVLSLIDNKTYQQLITDRVLKPMKMLNTFVDVPESHLSLFSDGHDAQLNKTSHWQLPSLAGAGAIRSNIKDMALYLQANIQQQPLNKAISLTHQQSIDLGEKSPKIGLAWFMVEHKNGSYLWHNGGTGGFRSFMGFDRVNKKGIVILGNTTHGLDDIGNAFLLGTLAQLKSDTFDTVDVAEEKLKKLNGRFELMPGFIMTVTNQAQQLFIQATGQAVFPVTAKSELEFVNLQAQAKITFELDDKGEAISLTLHQGGQSRKAKILSGDSLTNNKDRIVLSSIQLDNLSGNFQLTPDFTIVTTHENGYLNIQATGQQKIPFETKSKSQFFNDMIQAKIVFELDKQGKAISLTLFQGGQELKGVLQK